MVIELKILIGIEEKEDALHAEKKVTRQETVDKKDSLTEEERGAQNTEEDQSLQAILDIVEEEDIQEEEEIEVMMILEVEEEIEVVEMIIEDILQDLTVEATKAMIVEEMENQVEEIIKIETIVEIEIQDLIQDFIVIEDKNIIDMKVKIKKMDQNQEA
jgi:hypothetical protein